MKSHQGRFQKKNLAFYVRFLVFFSCFAGKNAFLDSFLVVFTVVWPLVWLLDPPVYIFYIVYFIK